MKNPRSPSQLRARKRGLSALIAAVLTLTVALTGCSRVASAGGDSTQDVLAKDDIVLVTTLITASNDYMQNWLKGSQAFADSVGLPLKVVVANGDSQQQLSQIQTVIASGKKVVLTTNPVASADVPAIVKAVVNSGGYVVTQWNKPDSTKPENYGPHYVAHIGYDGITGGKFLADKLFAAMGGQGGIIALHGTLDSTADKQRWAGLEESMAENPGIELLGVDQANWDQQTAFTKTQALLAKYGDQVKAVWTGSDSMALGALAAAKAAGRDDIKVVGMDGITQAVQAVAEGGPYIATWNTDGYYSGALGLAMGYAAATGELDVSKMTPDQRDGTYSQVGIDSSNVNEYLTPPTGDQIMAEVDKGLFARLTGPALTNADLPQ